MSGFLNSLPSLFLWSIVIGLGAISLTPDKSWGTFKQELSRWFAFSLVSVRRAVGREKSRFLFSRKAAWGFAILAVCTSLIFGMAWYRTTTKRLAFGMNSQQWHSYCQLIEDTYGRPLHFETYDPEVGVPQRIERKTVILGVSSPLFMFGAIENRQFYECVIVGPALMAGNLRDGFKIGRGCTVINNEVVPVGVFSAEEGESKTLSFAGATVVKDSEFERCLFEKISFFVPRSQVDELTDKLDIEVDGASEWYPYVEPKNTEDFKRQGLKPSRCVTLLR